MEYRNRITGLEYIDSRELAPHPGNWRDHGKAQTDALKGVLAEVGVAGALLAYRSERNGGKLTVIDGHLRKDAAPQAWPVLVLDVTDAEADYLLATHDPLAAMADTDAAALDALLASVNSGEAAAQEMLAKLAEDAGLWEPKEDYESGEGENADGDPLARADVPDAVWPTDNGWGVPTLDLKLQALAFDQPAAIWGQVSRKTRMNGTWLFYTEDGRYEALWADPSPVLNTGAVAAVEPNYSCYSNMPGAVALWQVYRKRWIARWWQSYGLRVWVDLNVATNHAEINRLGIPHGWRAFATRGYTDRLDATRAEYELACEIAGDASPLFLVYGGGKAVKAECMANGWLWMAEDMDRAKSSKIAEAG